jgi:hypothetical protein
MAAVVASKDGDCNLQLKELQQKSLGPESG